MIASIEKPTVAQAVALTATTMEKVHRHIDHYLQKAADMLVAFDIDMTLTTPQHPACYYPNMQRYKNAISRRMLWQRLFGCISKTQEDKVLTLGTQLPSQQLIEADTPALIASLQKRGVKSIALTASLSGGVEGLENLKERRFEGLQQVGIDFSKTFPHEDILFSEFPPHNNHYPIYHQGILYANGGNGANNKGAVLVAFLKKVGWKPQKVVMVDDLVGNLTAIAQALAAFDPNIQFIGIEYHGAQTYAPEGITKKEIITYWKDIISRVKAGR
ncbi:MAG: DUF2608 domain-containing protein [Bacteroidota bacterium]